MKITTLNLVDTSKHRGLRFIAVFSLLFVTILVVSCLPASAVNNYARSITMSSAKPSEPAVTYTVEFTADSSYSLQTLIVDFCSNSPLAGQNCTAPTGFTVGASPTAVAPTINGTPALGTWAASSQNSGRTFVYSSSVGVAINAGDVVAYSITSVTNPSSITSFYGRMFSYSSSSPTYSDTDTDIFEDNGGTALATANGIGFVFQVPESLQFCVYKDTCGDAPVVVLGHGPNNVLDSNQIDSDYAKFSIATNALGGATVYGNGYPPALSPTKYLTPLTPNGSQTTMVAGTEAFGMRILPANGDIAANYCYRDFGGDDYCYDTNMMPPPDGLGSTELTRQDTPGPIPTEELTITFAATASPTTPGGTYQTVISLIAVGEY